MDIHVTKWLEILEFTYQLYNRTLQLFHTTGSVTKKQYPKERAYRKLTPPFELFILNKVIEKPGVFLKEVQEALQDELYTVRS